MDNHLQAILELVKNKKGVDFSGYRPRFVERRIRQRFTATACKTLQEYYYYLLIHSDELNLLFDLLTINVSKLFRHPLIFDYFGEMLLPEIIRKKIESNNRTIRIWSAGCACGEEAYSLAMTLVDVITRKNIALDLDIFATDIDTNVLDKAKIGRFRYESIENVKTRFLKDYFHPVNDEFQICSKIRSLITFSRFDLINSRTYAPSESVFGSFDIVLCRNVLIYYQTSHQCIIFDKLYRSLSKGGYLVLGRTETPVESYRNKFIMVCEGSCIYQKL